MKKQLNKWWLLAPIFLIIGALCGFYIGATEISRASMRSEYIVHYFNYKAAENNPQLREYLKSRMYFIASSLNKKDLEGYKVDLGPVDTGKLKGVSGIKGPESEEENYLRAISKHK